MENRRTITNTTGGWLPVLVEPDGLDYWLAPGESLELRAAIDSPDEDFEIDEDESGVTVHPSPGMGFIAVYAGDRPLANGHGRPDGWRPPAR